MGRLLVLILALGLAAGTVQAYVTTRFVLDSVQNIDGDNWNVWHMMVDTDDDWTNSRLDISLTSGAMYHHAFGGNSARTRRWWEPSRTWPMTRTSRFRTTWS